MDERSKEGNVQGDHPSIRELRVAGGRASGMNVGVNEAFISASPIQSRQHEEMIEAIAWVPRREHRSRSREAETTGATEAGIR